LTGATDPALDTLFQPIRDGNISWPDNGVLFLRARIGGLPQERKLPGLVCEQTFKLDAAALERAGFAVNVAAQRKYALVLLLPPRQRDEARALLARALGMVSPGGQIVASVANNEGARSSESDLEKLCGSVTTLSKNKCRVFWATPMRDAAESALAKEWRELDAARRIAGGRFLSRPGVFAWDRIDVASELLATHLPPDLTGHAADLGAGFGYLSAELLTRCKGIAALDLFEAEARALDLARENLASIADRKLEFHWHDVTTGLPRKYDVIVTNPPFHTHSYTERPDVGRRFIAVAAASLNRGGRLWLVANRHLPYETVLDEQFGGVRQVTQSHGFKIIEAVKSGAAR